jgi:hypothetical protein
VRRPRPRPRPRPRLAAPLGAAPRPSRAHARAVAGMPRRPHPAAVPRQRPARRRRAQRRARQLGPHGPRRRGHRAPQGATGADRCGHRPRVRAGQAGRAWRGGRGGCAAAGAARRGEFARGRVLRRRGRARHDAFWRRPCRGARPPARPLPRVDAHFAAPPATWRRAGDQGPGAGGDERLKPNGPSPTARRHVAPRPRRGPAIANARPRTKEPSIRTARASLQPATDRPARVARPRARAPAGPPRPRMCYLGFPANAPAPPEAVSPPAKEETVRPPGRDTRRGPVRRPRSPGAPVECLQALCGRQACPARA